MGCACNQAGGTTIAQVAMQRLAPTGAVEASPLVIGEANDADAIRVRVITPAAGLRRGNAYWVTGDGVDALLEAGSIVDITKIEQKARQWRVPGTLTTYSDLQTARRVAAALGTTPIEVA